MMDQAGQHASCPKDAHPIGILQVLDGCALCQELRVGQDLKVHIWVSTVPAQHLRAEHCVRQAVYLYGACDDEKLSPLWAYSILTYSLLRAESNTWRSEVALTLISASAGLVHSELSNYIIVFFSRCAHPYCVLKTKR